MRNFINDIHGLLIDIVDIKDGVGRLVDCIAVIHELVDQQAELRVQIAGLQADVDELTGHLFFEPEALDLVYFDHEGNRYGVPAQPKSVEETNVTEDIHEATFPHCDSGVLHAPSECVFCDHYPAAQAERDAQGVNFTGHHDPDKLICPSERNRPLDVIEHWSGNVPVTQEMLDERDRAYAAMMARQFPDVYGKETG